MMSSLRIVDRLYGADIVKMKKDIHNISTHKIMWDKNPKEVFTGVKTKVNHLRIFGFPVYIHVSKEKRKKLKPSRKKGTFVGYSEA